MLVTGGAGFIGSHVVDALQERGHEVTVLDDLSTGRRDNLSGALERGVTLHEVDLRDGAAVLGLVRAVEPRAIFHLGAQIDVRRSIADPGFDARVNVEGTVNVLEAARATAVPRVVNTSSGGAIYGNAEVLPTPEATFPAPMAPYGQSKFAGEGYCDLYTRLHGLSTASLRYGNVFGPRQDPLGEAGVIAIFCGRLQEGMSPTVFGDGRQTRDYVYVGDVVAANLAAADSAATGPFNIGRGEEISVLDLVEALREIAGDPGFFAPGFEPARLGELERSCVDPSRARTELDWEARTGLVEGLRTTLASLGAPT
ncbi:MAG: NAD-dependent epimerase/dehydratase family protein [Solirubrobacteraceae bacterium MAG38_C4-C5]|nr:NAD-dependent epimerase/dehydratase family protein [Candidatus Siliceabacter maunaloa]